MLTSAAIKSIFRAEYRATSFHSSCSSPNGYAVSNLTITHSWLRMIFSKVSASSGRLPLTFFQIIFHLLNFDFKTYRQAHAPLSTAAISTLESCSTFSIRPEKTPDKNIFPSTTPHQCEPAGHDSCKISHQTWLILGRGLSGFDKWAISTVICTCV